MSQYGWATCPLDVRQQVERLVASVRAALSDGLVGVYLHGSLAMGCFNPLRSDLDMLVITQRRTEVSTKRALIEQLLAQSLAPSPVEISFLARSQLIPWRHPTPFDLHFSEAWRDHYLAALASGVWRRWNDAEQRDEDMAGHVAVTRQRGICLHGASIAEVFPVAPRADFLASVLADVLSPTCGVNSTMTAPVYVILNACRTLAYLQAGRVLSKDEGGVWALHVLPAHLRAVVDAALVAYRTDGDDARLAAFDVMGFADFVRREIVSSVE